MATVISVLLIIACVLLALIVLIQNPKGGGLDSSYGSSSQLGGVKQTTDFLEKATWTLAIVIMALSIVSSAFQGGTGLETNDASDAFTDEAPIAAPATQPVATPIATPVEVPAEETAE
jgi:preprotein translocase subunit SecG